MFEDAHNQQSYLKGGIFGFAGSGKTFTAHLIALGIHQTTKSEKPVGMLDSETGSDALVHKFKAAQVPFKVKKSRAFKDLKPAIKWAEENLSVLIIDSITHFWTDLQESYLQDKQARFRKRFPNRKPPDDITFPDWRFLKRTWGEFTDLYLNSKVHIIICGRAGYSYDFFTDDNGRKQLEKTDTKMKTETEMAYEPPLLIEMIKEKYGQTIEGKMWTHKAIILKDKFDAIEGRSFNNPTFNDFKPHWELLNVGGEHYGVSTENSEKIFETNEHDDFPEYRKQKDILLEEIQGEITAAYPSQSATDKKAKADLVYKVFHTRSWIKVTSMSMDDLKEGLITIQKTLYEVKNPPKKDLKNLIDQINILKDDMTPDDILIELTGIKDSSMKDIKNLGEASLKKAVDKASAWIASLKDIGAEGDKK